MKRFACLVVLLAGASASADVYRCTDASGSLTFSQTPCAGGAERVNLDATKSKSATECRYAEPFARAIGSMMRRGMEKDDAMEEFGGADEFSRGALRLVNYVYQYRNTSSMSVDRIVTLTSTQCETGTLGDVSCSALPEAYTKAGGGCGGGFSAERAAPQASVFGLNHAARAEKQRESAARTAAQGEKMMQQYEDQRRIDACRANIDQRIAEIETLIYAGADPNGHRLELQRLRKKRSECR